ncbi:hypothetical protein GIB67_009192 [Kingdonia uniflora]|uniref:Uncharacterized protein n=1 Tax=Kingdonia uniflora TaxID=39325 RepID=A0A7J7N2C6_9MAGN|nr:hypothetical protein GIB67_009192 [Kingdonia uniflora]
MGSSSVNEVSTFGQTNESDNEGEVGLEQFPGFPSQLVSYPPSSDTFKEFCKANAIVGGKWGNCVEFTGVKSKVERNKSLLNEVAEEETELELVLEGLGLSRKKRLDSSSAQPNPVKPRKMALKYSKKWMLKAHPASGTTGSGEVAHLVKGIWLGIEEGKSELKKENAELEKELAQSRTDALKEVRLLKASHAVAIGQLQVETKANLDEMVEECVRLGRHLMLKGYSEEEVDAIKADTYAEEEDEEEVEAVEIVDSLDGVSCQTVLDNQVDDVELPKGGSEKAG